MKKENFIEGMTALLEDFTRTIGSDSNSFDCDSEDCKNCKFFGMCKRFDNIKKVIESNIKDKDICEDCICFLEFFKFESKRTKSLTKEIIVKNLNKVSFDVEYKRYATVINEFKHWDVIRDVLSVNDLAYLKTVVHRTVKFTRTILDYVDNANLDEYNTICKLLTKEEDECAEPDYANMSKEELIEILKNK